MDSANGKYAQENITPKARSNGHVVIHVEAFAPKPEPEVRSEPQPLEVSYEHDKTGGQTRAENTTSGGVAALLPSDPGKLAQLREDVENLKLAASPAAQLEASAALARAGDSGLAALAVYGLYNDLPSVREQSVNLLADWGGQRALKPLIEAFYAGASETVPPYQVPYMEILARELSWLTGEVFPFHARFGANPTRVASAMVKWWNDHIYDVPPQLGEPEISPSAADYRTVVSSFRKLKLERREFSGFVYPPSLVAAPMPNTPNEEQFLKTFPKVPDSFGNSREMPTSNDPIVEKESSSARDWPGALRQKDMEERMKWEEKRMGTEINPY